MTNRDYVEVVVDGLTCYVSHDDFSLFYGLSAHSRDTHIPFDKLPEGASIIVLSVWRKSGPNIYLRGLQTESVKP
jgi:hypothetical protein